LTLLLEIGLKNNTNQFTQIWMYYTCCVLQLNYNHKGKPSLLSSLLCSSFGSCGLSSLNLGNGSRGSNNLCGGSSGGLSWYSRLSSDILLCSLFLGILGDEFLVLLMGLLGSLVAVLDIALVKLLASQTSFGDQALDLRGLVESLVLTLNLTTNNILANIILLLVESECLNNVVSSLGTESVGAGYVGDTIDLLFSLLDNTELDGSEVGAVDATTD